MELVTKNGKKRSLLVLDLNREDFVTVKWAVQVELEEVESYGGDTTDLERIHEAMNEQLRLYDMA